MSNVIINLAARRQSPFPSTPSVHPERVVLPLNDPTFASLIAPEICSEICSGAYNSDLLRGLPGAVLPGDRVLLIGGGLGVASTLVARCEGVDRIIVAEPNCAMLPFIDRVHDLNGVSDVEMVNAMPAVGKMGRIPFCAQHDPRTSTFVSDCQLREQAVMVPSIDLNLILAEERISLIVCDTPTAPAQLLVRTELGQVDRILLNIGSRVGHCGDGGGICAQLAARGYYPEPSGAAILLCKSTARRGNSTHVATPANLNSAPVRVNLG